MTEPPVDPGRAAGPAPQVGGTLPGSAVGGPSGSGAAGAGRGGGPGVGESLDFTVLAVLGRGEGVTAADARAAGHLLRIVSRYGLHTAWADRAMSVGSAHRASVQATQPLRLELDAARAGSSSPSPTQPPSVPAALRTALRTAARVDPTFASAQDAARASWQQVLRGDGGESGAGRALRELVGGAGRHALLDAVLKLARGAGAGAEGARPAANGLAGEAADSAEASNADRGERPRVGDSDAEAAVELLRRAARSAEGAPPGGPQGLQELVLPGLPLAGAAAPSSSIEALRWFVGTVGEDEASRGSRADGDADFVVVVLVELSRLGAVRADLRFLGAGAERHVHVSVCARKGATTRLLSNAEHDLRSALADCGLNVGQVGIREAVCVEEMSRGLPSPGASGDGHEVDCRV